MRRLSFSFRERRNPSCAVRLTGCASFIFPPPERRRNEAWQIEMSLIECFLAVKLDPPREGARSKKGADEELKKSKKMSGQEGSIQPVALPPPAPAIEEHGLLWDTAGSQRRRSDLAADLHFPNLLLNLLDGQPAQPLISVAGVVAAASAVQVKKAECVPSSSFRLTASSSAPYRRPIRLCTTRLSSIRPLRGPRQGRRDPERCLWSSDRAFLVPNVKL